GGTSLPAHPNASNRPRPTGRRRRSARCRATSRSSSRCRFEPGIVARMWRNERGKIGPGPSGAPHVRIQQLQRVLSVLSRRAPQSHLPAAALHRQHAGDRGAGAGAVERPAALAVADAGGRLRLRLDRPLRLREEPAGHLQASALQLAGRLGDVWTDADGQDPLLISRQLAQRYFWWQLLQLSLTGLITVASAAQVAGAACTACCRWFCNCRA